MSRLFLVLLVAGAFVMAPAASADVPDCDCTVWAGKLWGGHPPPGPATVNGGCVVSCPGAWGQPGHNPGEETDWVICLYTEDCLGPMVGFDCLRIALADVDPDSICVCEEECADWTYIYPEGPTDGTGCTSFRFRGTILNLEDDTSPGAEIGRVQVCGCPDIELLVRSPDVNADCVVGLTDFVVFGSAFALYPCVAQPTGLQHYTVYTGHCAPCNHPSLSDFVVFGKHFDHKCEPAGSCDP